jgi:leucyl aminopeptidase
METKLPKLTSGVVKYEDVNADWLIIPTFEGEPLSADVAELDASLRFAFTNLRGGGDLTGKANELVPLLGLESTSLRRVLFVGLGKRPACDQAALYSAATAAARAVTGKPTSRLAFVLPDYLAMSDAARAVGAGLAQGCIGPGLRKAEPSRFAPEELRLVAAPGADAAALEASVRRAAAEAGGVALARELVNLPPCDLDPERFAEQARTVAANSGFECEVLDEPRLQAERMGALLGVARGSDRPPRVVVLRYRRGQAAYTLGLVGKGVTFDSGGLSLKTNEQMVDMKCDMAGAAAVLGAFQAVAELGLPVNLLGVCALVENMPSGRALKLGDVLRARNGKSIEVLNTDAEGRVVLADALSYAVDLGASHLLDLATLTGSCMIALGASVAGMMTNHEGWGQTVLTAAARSGERAWPLPMWPLYDELLKSNVADLKNAPGTRYGGAIAGAKFLEQFVGGKPWAHLDIAGPAWVERECATHDAGGTGYGVRTIVELASSYQEPTTT